MVYFFGREHTIETVQAKEMAAEDVSLMHASWQNRICTSCLSFFLLGFKGKHRS